MTQEHSQRIEELYLEMYRLLLQYANNTLRNSAQAEEAVQDTFRIACMKPGELFASPNPRGWLLQTLKYVIQNIVRSQVRAEQLPASLRAGGAPPGEGYTPVRVLYGDLSGTEDFRLLQELSEGKTMLEMARSRNISVEACKKRVQRARKHLQKALKV